jgi:hypothetical protein
MHELADHGMVEILVRTSRLVRTSPDQIRFLSFLLSVSKLTDLATLPTIHARSSASCPESSNILWFHECSSVEHCN